MKPVQSEQSYTPCLGRRSLNHWTVREVPSISTLSNVFSPTGPLEHITCMLSCFSYVWLFVILWTIACQAPLSMGFSRQEYWSGLPCPPPRDLPDPGIELGSLTSPALAGRFFTTSTPYKFIQRIMTSQSSVWPFPSFTPLCSLTTSSLW